MYIKYFVMLLSILNDDVVVLKFNFILLIYAVIVVNDVRKLYFILFNISIKNIVKRV